MGDELEQRNSGSTQSTASGGGSQAPGQPGGSSRGVAAPPPVQQQAIQLTGGGIDTDAGRLTDWSAAVAQIQGLYIGTNVGLGWRRARGVEQWRNQSDITDPAPVWQNLLVSAIGIAVGAATAGVGAAIIAGATSAASSALAQGIINGAAELGKNAVNGIAGAVVSEAVANYSSNGKLAYVEASSDAVDQEIEVEWNAALRGINDLAARPDAEKWGALQAIYNGVRGAREQAQSIQYGETLEGWMRASSQASTGSDFSVGGRTLTSMYRSGQLTITQMQQIEGHLRIGQPLSRLSGELQTALSAALNNRSIAELERGQTTTTRTEPLADTFSTSSVGTLGLHLSLGPPTQDPTVEYAEIESSTGVNEDTQNYFLRSPKKLKDFKVPKILVSDSFSLAVNETGEISENRVLVGDQSQWLLHYGAAKMGQPLTANNRAGMRVAARAFIGHAILEKSLRQLGVNSISS